LGVERIGRVNLHVRFEVQEVRRRRRGYVDQSLYRGIERGRQCVERLQRCCRLKRGIRKRKIERMREVRLVRYDLRSKFVEMECNDPTILSFCVSKSLFGAKGKGEVD